MEAVAGAGDLDQRGAADVLTQLDGIGQGCQCVAGAVEDEGGRLDGAEFAPRVMLPAGAEVAGFRPADARELKNVCVASGWFMAHCGAGNSCQGGRRRDFPPSTVGVAG